MVTPSQFVARTLAEHGVPPDKVRVNPFGVDLGTVPAGRATTIPRPLRFLFAGSFLPRKGVPLLLSAWSRLPRGCAAELWMVGGGEIPAGVRSSLPEAFAILGRVPQAELAALFRQCHVFVFPSYFEGLAQVPVEAAASGLPVIGSESSGCEEVVRHGESGLVLATGDEDGLHEALLSLIRTPETVLAMRERVLADREKLSWETYGQRWMQILGEEIA